MRLSAIDKEKLLAELCEKLSFSLGELTLAQKSSQEGATHEENRSESDKDMRATEASYIARGQALRVVTLREELALLSAFRPKKFDVSDTIAAGALVVLRDEAEKEVVHWVLPAGGGVSLSSAGRPIAILTTRSPLGQNLLGLMGGDTVGLDGPEGSREFEVVEVA